MTRTHGRSPIGTRLIERVPSGRWKTTTFLGALRAEGFIAPLTIEGAINGPLFLAWVQQQLAPVLRPGDVVVMDNLSSHKVAGVREAIEATGAELRYLPPYTPARPIARLLQPNFLAACDKPATRVSLRKHCDGIHFGGGRVAQVSSSVFTKIPAEFETRFLLIPRECVRDFCLKFREFAVRREFAKLRCRGEIRGRRSLPSQHAAEPRCQAGSYALRSGVRSFSTRSPVRQVGMEYALLQLRPATHRLSRPAENKAAEGERWSGNTQELSIRPASDPQGPCRDGHECSC